MRIVVKVGTSTLAYAGGRLNIRRVEEICKILSDLENAGNEIILVSSGAIGLGVGKLSLAERPSDLPGKQAAAAIGQCELMYTYDRQFSAYNHTVAQLLITANDIENEHRSQQFQNTLYRLLDFGVIPIINENDTISTDEIVIGDNDTLAAFVARTIAADLLVILTDKDGLYSANPEKDADACLITDVWDITPNIEAMAGGAGSALGTGGMATKIAAAKIATAAGVDTVITSGKCPRNLYAIADGEQVGTRFHAHS